MGAETWKSLRYLAKTEGIRVEGFRFRMDVFGFDVLRVRSFFFLAALQAEGLRLCTCRPGFVLIIRPRASLYNPDCRIV